MFTPLEQILINFPDIAFEKKHGIYTASVPDYYTSKYSKLRTEFTFSAVRANACLTQHGQEERVAWIVKPFNASGFSEQACAKKLLKKLSQGQVSRHVRNPDSDVVPIAGISYFPVFNDDFFHDHGDPSFIDMSRVEHRTKDDIVAGDFRPLNSSVETLGLSFDPELEEGLFQIDAVMIKEISLFLASQDPFAKEIPISCPEEGAITFDLNFGDYYCHFIDAQTLAQKLEA